MIIFQTALVSPRKNADQRITTAYNIFEEHKKGLLLIHKTTRAGCTTALGSEALNRGEPVLMIVPTNAIAQKTIVKDMKEYSDVKNPHIIHIKSNHNCLINEEMCEEYPDLKNLPILPLPQSCEGCVNYNQCPITEILRHQDVDGVVLTYSKLVAAMLRSGGFKETMGDKIIKEISLKHNIVFDEIHEIQYGKAASLTVYNNSENEVKNISLDQYKILNNNYPELWNLVTKFQMFISEPSTQATVHEMYNAASEDDFWKKHLSNTVKNNWHDEVHYSSKIIKAIYAEIIELTKKRIKYNLTMRDVLNLYTIMNIVMAERVSIHSTRDQGEIKVIVSAVDLLYTEMIKSFAMSVQNKDKRIMLTSATICSFDYGKLFMGNKQPDKLLFGRYGDPMNTNNKMTIYADIKTYTGVGRYSFIQKKTDIINTIIKILNEHGDKNCLIIAPNMKLSYIFENELKNAGHEHDITYYKSPEMMGVSNSARVMIAIGVAYKPSNAFDVITESYECSQSLKMESIHADTWQAWSRVKDPSGIKESFVYALGVREQMCNDIVKWGYGRKVTQSNTNDKERNFLVNLEKNNISIPNILVNTCELMGNRVQKAETHCKNLVPDFIGKYHYNIYWYYLEKTGTRFLKSEILKKLLNRTDVFAEQTFDGSGYFKVVAEISDQLLENHIAGKITIGGYCLNQSNEVTSIVYDIDAHPNSDDSKEDIIQKQQKADQDLNTMISFLNSVSIPHIVEASGSPHSYHVWIVLKPVKAIIAKSFGKELMQDVGIKCELFPKQATIRRNAGYGNLVKLPFAINKKSGKRSMFMIDGQFVEEFENINIGEMDISTYSTTVNKHKPVNSIQIPKIISVRPCISSALNMALTGHEGHMMRIAIVREYYNCGMTDPANISELFKMQTDYDYDKTLYHVNSIIEKPYAVWTKKTIQDQCGSFVDCDNCDHFVCKERYV